MCLCAFMCILLSVCTCVDIHMWMYIGSTYTYTCAWRYMHMSYECIYVVSHMHIHPYVCRYEQLYDDANV